MLQVEKGIHPEEEDYPEIIHSGPRLYDTDMMNINEAIPSGLQAWGGKCFALPRLGFHCGMRLGR